MWLTSSSILVRTSHVVNKIGYKTFCNLFYIKNKKLFADVIPVLNPIGWRNYNAGILQKNWRELMLKYRVITFDRTNPSLDWTQLRTSNNQIGNQKLYFWFQIEGNLLGFQKRIKFHLRSTLPGVQVRRHDHLPRGRPQRQSTGRYVPFPRFGTPRKCFVRRSLLRSRAWVIRMGRSHLQGRQK